MEDNNKKPTGMPDLRIVKGLIAVMLGIICIMLAHSIIIKMVCFIVGLFLIYYGLSILNIQVLQQGMNTIKSYCQRFFS